MVISDSNNFFRELNAKNEGCMLRFQSSYHPNQQLNIETKMMKLIENEIEIMNSASHPCCESFYLLAQITRGYTNTKRNTNSNTEKRHVISSFSIPLHIDWKVENSDWPRAHPFSVWKTKNTAIRRSEYCV